MNAAIIILALVALASAAPKVTNLDYRNLYKQPIKTIHGKPNPEIIGGVEATPHSIPYQVFLEMYTDVEGWYCGGSLISRNYVITSGSCGDRVTEADITLGAHRPLENEDTQVKVVSQDVTVHEEFDAEQIINDIAVIRLPLTVGLTDAIQLVSLPTNASNTYVGAFSTASGWGLTDGEGSSLSNVLNYANLQVISNADCETFYGTLPSSNLCTSGAQNTGICNGDAGGPLVSDGALIGVISFSVVDCVSGYPSGFTRITSFLDWLTAHADV